MRRLSLLICLAGAILAALASSGRAQETVTAGQPAVSAVRVIRDKAPIWRRNPSLVIASVKQGTVLRAISREEQWYEVVVPEEAGGTGETGFIYVGAVELMPGAPEPPRRKPGASAEPAWGTEAPGAEHRAAPVARPDFGVRGFGSFSYMFFQAHDSFDAILGSSSQPFFGGGGQVVLWDRVFVSASFEYFKKTGERVIVHEGEVFPLGIDDTVTIQPFTVTGGYRFRSADRFVPYVGGGIGSYHFKEESEFATADENVDERFTSYHALAGVEYAVSKWVFASFEVQYTSVPDALGAPGVSGDFDETNLGGLSLGVKVAVGR
jgi:opacity protein-like surface antigen